jgi:hypothetical protein
VGSGGTAHADVIAAGASGFMTGADKTKLNGIEAAADVTDAGNVGQAVFGSSPKTTPVDADTVAMTDSGASNSLIKVLWSNIKATLKTYFDTLYAASANGVTNGDTHDHVGGDGGQIAYGSLSGTPSLGTAAPLNVPVAGDAAAGEVVKGNDSRLTNTRTPVAHKTSHEPGGGDAMAVDAAAATGSLRTLGTGALQATAGNDSRLSNSRTPTAHASTHATGQSDAITPANIGAAVSAAGVPVGGSTDQILAKNSGTDRDLKWATPAVVEKKFTFILHIGEPATVGLNKTNAIIVPSACTVQKAFAYAKIGPTGTALIFDINKNGTSLWASTQANRIQIAASAVSGTQTSFDTTALAEGDVLTIDIDQIGSTIAGQDITVTLKCS